MDYFKLRINDTIFYNNKTYTVVEAADYTDYDVKWKEYLIESGSENFWISFYNDKISGLQIYEYNEIDFSGYSEVDEIEYNGERYTLLNKGRVMATVTFDNNEVDTYKVGYFNYADYRNSKFFAVRKVENEYKYYQGILISEANITIRNSAAGYNNNSYGYNNNNNYNSYNPSQYTTTTVTTDTYIEDGYDYTPSAFSWKTFIFIGIFVLFLIFILSTCSRVSTYYDSRPSYGRTYYNDSYYHHDNYYYGGTRNRTRVTNVTTYTTTNVNSSNSGYSGNRESSSSYRRSSFKSWGSGSSSHSSSRRSSGFRRR